MTTNRDRMANALREAAYYELITIYAQRGNSLAQSISNLADGLCHGVGLDPDETYQPGPHLRREEPS